MSPHPDRATWDASLPRLTADLLAEWELVVDDVPLPGSPGVASQVLPVTGPLGPAVLKVAWPHDEAEHEALGLQRLGGRGAVRLLRADPHRWALLLERLPGPDLTGLWDVEACEVVGGLYAALHVPAPPQLRTLASYVEEWGGRLARLPRSAPLPRRLVEQAVALGRDLLVDGPEPRMLHTDLHDMNVLAGHGEPGRSPWLAIDPKPVAGDPHYEPAPMLWNRWDEVVTSGDVRAAVRRRFHTLVDTAGLDEDRARDWVVVRMLHHALWALEDAEEDGTPVDADRLTTCVTIAKAVQD